MTRGTERLRQLGWGNKRFKFPSGEEPLTQKMKKTGWNERDKKRAEGEKGESRAWRCVWTVDCEGPWGRPVSPWPLRTDLKKKRVQRFERRDGNVQVAGLGVQQNETGDCPACLAWHPGPRSNFA